MEEEKKQGEKDEEEEEEKFNPKYCNHGPKGSCTNCLKYKFTKDPMEEKLKK